jgi:hypothetical protein
LDRQIDALPDPGPSQEPALLIVRSRAARQRPRSLLRRWLAVCDHWGTAGGALLADAVRALLPLPRSA